MTPIKTALSASYSAFTSPASTGALHSPQKTVMKRTYVLRPVATDSGSFELRDLSEQHHAAHCKEAVTYFRKARAANERYAEYKRKENENRFGSVEADQPPAPPHAQGRGAEARSRGL